MQLEIVLKKVYRCVVIFCGCVVMACGCVVMACGCAVENTDLVVYYIKAAYYMGIIHAITICRPQKSLVHNLLPFVIFYSFKRAR